MQPGLVLDEDRKKERFKNVVVRQLEEAGLHAPGEDNSSRKRGRKKKLKMEDIPEEVFKQVKLTFKKGPKRSAKRTLDEANQPSTSAGFTGQLVSEPGLPLLIPIHRKPPSGNNEQTIPIDYSFKPIKVEDMVNPANDAINISEQRNRVIVKRRKLSFEKHLRGMRMKRWKMLRLQHVYDSWKQACFYLPLDEKLVANLEDFHRDVNEPTLSKKIVEHHASKLIAMFYKFVTDQAQFAKLTWSEQMKLLSKILPVAIQFIMGHYFGNQAMPEKLAWLFCDQWDKKTSGIVHRSFSDYNSILSLVAEKVVGQYQTLADSLVQHDLPVGATGLIMSYLMHLWSPDHSTDDAALTELEELICKVCGIPCNFIVQEILPILTKMADIFGDTFAPGINVAAANLMGNQYRAEQAWLKSRAHYISKSMKAIDLGPQSVQSYINFLGGSELPIEFPWATAAVFQERIKHYIMTDPYLNVSDIYDVKKCIFL